MSWYGIAGGGLPAGTSMCSLPTPSPNLYGRVVASALTNVGTTTSVLSNPLVDLLVYLLKSPSRP